MTHRLSFSRRQFMKTSLVGGGVLGFPSLFGCSSPGSENIGATKAHSLATPASNGHGTITWLSTERIGPLTGPSDFGTQDLSPLQDTTLWGVAGIDEGVSVVYKNRTYIYFGDANPYPRDVSRVNMDLIAWIDDPTVLRHGGHSAQGLTFYLPNDQQVPPPSTGQPDWRFCVKCTALFSCPHGQTAGSKCPYDGGEHAPAGLDFWLPDTQDGATSSTGQVGWRLCNQCHGLCWALDKSPVGTCPAGGKHSPGDMVFVLPNDTAGATSGQGSWRFCGDCSGLFFNGYATKGVCPGAPGGGLRLNPVLQSDGQFYGFNGSPPEGYTLSLERPGGAFVWNDQVCVFANISPFHYSRQSRPGNPQTGTYLLNTGTPDQPAPLDTLYLLSPRIGNCVLPDGTVRSHQAAGFDFFLPYSASASPDWRYCTSCASLFHSIAGNAGRCFGNPEGHTPAGVLFAPVAATAEDVQHQSSWRACSKCLTMVFDGYDTKGTCPAGGTHTADTVGPTFSIAHIAANLVEDNTHQPDWRFCTRCAGLFLKDSYPDSSSPPDQCPAGGGHNAEGLNFCLTHDVTPSSTQQDKWCFCVQCGGLFWAGNSNSRCPRGGPHVAGQPAGIALDPNSEVNRIPDYVLDHDIAADVQHQGGWQCCTQCAGLFWSGASTTACPVGGNHHGSGNFVLPFNPMDDGATLQGGWRYCAQCEGMVWTGQEDTFGGAIPYVVTTADHPELPPPPANAGVTFSDKSAVLLSHRYANGSHPAGFSVACWPLPMGAAPRLQDILYYNPANGTWTPDVHQVTTNLFDSIEDGYTENGLLWLPGPQLWMVTYTRARNIQNDDTALQKPVVALFSNRI